MKLTYNHLFIEKSEILYYYNLPSLSQSTLPMTTLPGSGKASLTLSAASSKMGCSKLLKRHHSA